MYFPLATKGHRETAASEPPPNLDGDGTRRRRSNRDERDRCERSRERGEKGRRRRT